MNSNSKVVGIVTLGCKVNQYESEAIAEALNKEGYETTNGDDSCFAYVINTCTVTAESDRKARQIIRRAMTKNPFAYILVTGCYSQSSPEALMSIAGIDYICGTSNKLSVVTKLKELDKAGEKNNIPEVNIQNLTNANFESMSIKHFDRTRAYVKIEDGCESNCTYCAIPGARGPIRSKPMSEVLDEVTYLTNQGCREIVLTGIETGSYGKDKGDKNGLSILLSEVDKIPGIGRIRLGSLDPSVIKPEFVEKIAPLQSLTHHFHLSLQSGSDRILALMKRKYNSRQALNGINLLRNAFPDLQLTTDIIVGFPGETEQDFEQTINFAKQAKFLVIHVFPYSKRKGTPAEKMPNQVPDDIKHERVHTLTTLSRGIRKNILDRLTDNQSEINVLFESASGGYMYGHTPQFVEVKVKTPQNLHSEVLKVRLLSNDGDVCEGILI